VTEVEPVVVRGIRYKPYGAALEAFRQQLNSDPELYARRDDFLTAMPDWALADLTQAAERLAARGREVALEKDWAWASGLQADDWAQDEQRGASDAG
jgi:hypothetical protein